MKPLYLDGRRPLHVSLPSDDSLRIDSPDLAAQWVPLGHISRVVSSGAVDWTLPALKRLMRARIPVAFFDGHGRLIGYCLGSRRQRLDLCQRIEELMDRPDWPALYGDWFRATQHDVMRGAALGTCDEAPTPRAVREHLLAHRAKRLGLRRAIKLQDTLRSELLARVAGWLHATGIHPAHIIADEGGLSLVHSLARLIEWELQPRIDAQLRRKLPGRALRYVAGFLDRHNDWLRGRFAEHLGSLDRWLRETAE